MNLLDNLKNLVGKITGKMIEVVFGQGAYTDGTEVTIPEFNRQFPNLPSSVTSDMAEVVTAHEASHIVKFKGMSSEDFYKKFVDPFSPDADSIDFVRFLGNVIEDKFVDEHACKYVSRAKQEQVNKFFVWNRQGGVRKSLAEMEATGSEGKCSAFIEAVFQFEVYGSIIESFHSPELEKAARDAARVIENFGRGSLKREDAVKRVIEILKKYCPPPWKLPKKYQAPRGENPSGKGDGNGQGEAGSSGEGEGSGTGEAGEEAGEGEGKGSGKGEGETESEGGDGDSDSEDGGEGRGTGGTEGEGKYTPETTDHDCEDPEMEQLMRALQRIVSNRKNQQTGRGKPHWRTYAPGDVINSPDEIQRWIDDDAYGVDPFKRRAVRQRRNQDYLLAVFIDSSGSVSDSLFSKLYRVMGTLADEMAEVGRLGVGQFSGGASWVLEPTNDALEIAEFAKSKPKRIYNGGTVVSEIFEIIKDFSDYSSADLVVLTDGYVEDGRSSLAPNLERAIEQTGCDIKLHGVVFRKFGSIRQFEKAKDVIPQSVRCWVLGRGEGSEE